MMLSLLSLVATSWLAAAATPESIEELERAAKGRAQIIGCGVEEECSPSIGQLLAYHPFQGSMVPMECSATLVGGDLILVAGRCLPPGLQRTGASCQRQAWVGFPADPLHPEYEETLNCRKVEHYQKGEGVKEGDGAYALLRMSKQSKRPSLQIARTRPGPFEAVRVLGTRDAMHYLNGVSLVSHCRFLLSDRGNELDFGLCKELMVRFDPGSVIVSKDNRVIGLSDHLTRDEPITNPSLQRLAKREGRVPNREIFFNLACAELPEFLNLGAPLPGCSTRGPGGHGPDGYYERRAYVEIGEEMDLFMLDFHLDSSADTNFKIMYPKCVRVPKLKLNETVTAELQIETPVLEAEMMSEYNLPITIARASVTVRVEESSLPNYYKVKVDDRTYNLWTCPEE